MRSPFHKAIWFGGVCAALLCCADGRAQPTEPAPFDPAVATLRVGVRVAPPFVIAQDGRYRGLAIQLWEDIARSHGWRYEYHPRPLPSLLQEVAEGRLDVAVGALTVTAERESRVDFSQPFAQSGLGIVVPQQATAPWLAIASGLLSWQTLRWIFALIGLLSAIGLLAWLFERRANPQQFGGGPWQGIGNGLWWAAVTMSTVGYGDKTPQTLLGRLLALIWMFTAIILLSVFTAGITASLTVGALDGRVRSADDLRSARVLAVAGSTGARWLSDHRIRGQLIEEVDDGLQLLIEGRADALLHDAAILSYSVQAHHSGQLQLLNDRLDRQNYAFALPEGRPSQREAIDQALLQSMETPAWREVLHRTLGEP